MAEPKSQPPEFEYSDLSGIDSNSASIERRGAESHGSFDSDVEDMLSSINVADSDLVEGENSAEIGTEGASSSPRSSGDDLLMRAGSILNGGSTEIPAIDSDTESEADTDLDELMSMPDPQTLMKEASAAAEKPDPKKPANIAERAGDLPPPPPAPVALEEDEIERALSSSEVEEPEKLELPNDLDRVLAEDSIAEVPEALPDGEKSVAIADEDSIEEGDESLESPVTESSETDDDDLLDEDDSFLMDDEGGDDFLLSIQKDTDIELNPETATLSGNRPLAANQGMESSSGDPKASPGFRALKAAMRSLPFAAAIALLGVGLIVSSIKNEIFEWVSQGDVQGSSITHRIVQRTNELFDDLGPDSPYRMVWLETGITRVSDTELHIDAQVGAELKVDLYQAVDESIIYSKLSFDREELLATVKKLEAIGREDLKFPIKGWDRLYKHSASKGEVFPFRLSYRLLKPSPDSDWEFTGMRMKEGEHGFAWSRGRPRAFFGANGVDVNSNEFRLSFRAFENAGMAYLEKASLAEKEYLAAVDKADKQAQAERQDLMMALSQGSYFKGMVIAGKEGADAREVSLIITETRNGGGMIKGLLKLEKEESPTKHFTGFFDVVENDQGVRGQLELTTIAFAGQSTPGGAPAFFNPGTVSRIKLHTDGYRMEGDTDEISLRLIRSL